MVNHDGPSFMGYCFVFILRILAFGGFGNSEPGLSPFVLGRVDGFGGSEIESGLDHPHFECDDHAGQAGHDFDRQLYASPGARLDVGGDFGLSRIML